MLVSGKHLNPSSLERHLQLLLLPGLLKAIFPRFSYVTCLAIAACLTPTDPIISASVVGNVNHLLTTCPVFMLMALSPGGGYAKKNVPAEIRHILLAGMVITMFLNLTLDFIL